MKVIKLEKNNIQGILYIIAAGAFFSLMTLFVRMSGDLPTAQKSVFRNLVAIFISFLLLARSKEKFTIQKGSLPSLIMRSLFGTLGILCNFYAIDRIGLADANILNKMSPFFAIIFSVFVLKEIANRKEWFCVIVAFIGVLFIIKPSGNLTSIYSLIGLVSGLCAGLAYTYVRKLGMHGERRNMIVFFFSTFSVVTTLPLMLYQWTPMSPSQLAILLLAGVAATGGQMCITTAYTKAAAKEISVFDYSQILFAALWGFLIFGEIPDTWSIIGYIIIIGVAIFKVL